MAQKLPLSARMLQRTADALDLPADMVAGAPRITIIGRGEVQIFHHTGILQFGQEQLYFGSRRGIIVVQGKALRLQAMNREDVTIVGEIEGVFFAEEVARDG